MKGTNARAKALKEAAEVEQPMERKYVYTVRTVRNKLRPYIDVFILLYALWADRAVIISFWLALGLFASQ
jgi:hypothetical protein